jgi:hypothetical protein
LTIRQKDVPRNGCAIEVRINAEDPFQNFRPDPGRIDAVAFAAQEITPPAAVQCGVGGPWVALGGPGQSWRAGSRAIRTAGERPRRRAKLRSGAQAGRQKR